MRQPKRGHHRQPVKRKVPGFALAEILLVVSVIGVVQALLFTSWRGQVAKGNDAKRKSDLTRIKTAFEEYYNDNNCYPGATSLSSCGATTLSPYLDKIPCDPTTKQPYQYVPLDDDPCTGYRVLAKLENKTDPDISRLGCHGDLACGFGAGYNYGISSGTVVLAPGVPTPTPSPTPTTKPTPTPTPTPTPAPTQFACSPQGLCNIYADPVFSGCPVTFPDDTCNNACGDPANRCTQ